MYVESHTYIDVKSYVHGKPQVHKRQKLWTWKASRTSNSDADKACIEFWDVTTSQGSLWKHLLVYPEI